MSSHTGVVPARGVRLTGPPSAPWATAHTRTPVLSSHLNLGLTSDPHRHFYNLSP